MCSRFNERLYFNEYCGGNQVRHPVSASGLHILKFRDEWTCILVHPLTWKCTYTTQTQTFTCTYSCQDGSGHFIDSMLGEGKILKNQSFDDCFTIKQY